MKVVQVVKRFGLCGGMEEYAYRLTNALSTQGVKVTVVCEKKVNELNDNDVQIFELGESLRKPRWLSHIFFAKKVRNWARLHANKNTIVHSHERIDCHHLTTIHSTLYNFPLSRKLPSLRNYFNEYIERRELNSSSVLKIIPVSELISNQIDSKYSSSRDKLVPAISPGVSPVNAVKKNLDLESPVIGFMGKEWKRKGLPKVIEIWRELRKEKPFSRLCLAGFPIDEPIGILEDELKFVDLLGHVGRKEDFYEKIDFLLHPALHEAYGMVITEAVSLGIPTLCTHVCGAAKTQNPLLKTLEYEDENSIWAEIIQSHILTSKLSIICKTRTWEDVTKDYIKVYHSITEKK